MSSSSFSSITRLCKIGKETRKKAKLQDNPQKELSSLLLCSVCTCPTMSKYSVHSVTLPGFIWSFGNVGEPEEKHPEKQQGAEGSPVVSLQWILGLWFRTSRQWWFQHRNGMSYLCARCTHCWATQPPVGVPQSPPRGSLFQTECQPGIRAVGMADSQEPLPNTLHRSNKRVWFVGFWLFVWFWGCFVLFSFVFFISTFLFLSCYWYCSWELL